MDLIGNKYILKPLSPKLISLNHVSWLNNPKINQYLEARYIIQTLESVCDYVATYHQNNQKYIWGIYPFDCDFYIGTATLKANINHKDCEIGVLIGDLNYWGKWASSEAIFLMSKFGFQSLALRRVSAGTYENNKAIGLILKRQGFMLEGVTRKAFIGAENNYIDGCRWGVLKNEWEVKHSKKLKN